MSDCLGVGEVNIATPQEQFESRKRLDSLFRPQAKPASVIKRVVEEPKPKRRYFTRTAAIQWFAERMPWPCYSDTNAGAILLKPDLTERISVRDILFLLVKEYGFEEPELLSVRRRAELVHTRQIAMYLARKCTSLSYPEIGRRLGGRDHTTVLHGVLKIEKMMAQSESFASEIGRLRATLEEGT